MDQTSIFNKVTPLISFLLAVISVLLVYYFYKEISLSGFPDGHITDYTQHILPFWKLGLAVYSLTAVDFLGLSLINRPSPAGRIFLYGGLILAVLTALLVFILLPWYFKDILHLDHGQGG